MNNMESIYNESFLSEDQLLNKLKIIKLNLSNNDFINYCTKNDLLQKSALYNKLKIFDFLIDYIDINNEDSEGKTCLFFCKNLNTLKHIQKYNPNYQHEDYRGKKFFEYVVKFSSINKREIINYIFENNLAYFNNNDDFFIDILKNNNNSEIKLITQKCHLNWNNSSKNWLIFSLENDLYNKISLFDNFELYHNNNDILNHMLENYIKFKKKDKKFLLNLLKKTDKKLPINLIKNFNEKFLYIVCSNSFFSLNNSFFDSDLLYSIKKFLNLEKDIQLPNENLFINLINEINIEFNNNNSLYSIFDKIPLVIKSEFNFHIINGLSFFYNDFNLEEQNSIIEKIGKNLNIEIEKENLDLQSVKKLYNKVINNEKLFKIWFWVDDKNLDKIKNLIDINRIKSFKLNEKIKKNIDLKEIKINKL